MADDITIESLTAEFRRVVDGIDQLAQAVHVRSEDTDDLKLFLATMREWRTALYRAELPAVARLDWLETLSRHASNSWAES